MSMQVSLHTLNLPKKKKDSFVASSEFITRQSNVIEG